VRSYPSLRSRIRDSKNAAPDALYRKYYDSVVRENLTQSPLGVTVAGGTVTCNRDPSESLLRVRVGFADYAQAGRLPVKLHHTIRVPGQGRRQAAQAAAAVIDSEKNSVLENASSADGQCDCRLKMRSKPESAKGAQ
jgi:hypothetical protein